MHALSNLDLVAHAQDHFPYGSMHVTILYNSDFRPCCYGVTSRDLEGGKSPFLRQNLFDVVIETANKL